LTKAEARVLALICYGLSAAAIAAQLDLSAHAIRYHNKSVLQKTATRRKADLLVKALSERNSLF
jgi:DNA-binding CsgD family transcriptional regulator